MDTGFVGEGNFPAVIIRKFFGFITPFQDPGLKFGICAADGLAVYLKMFIILIKHIQGFVGIFQGKPIHVLKISSFLKKSFPFGARIEDARKFQETGDSVNGN